MKTPKNFIIDVDGILNTGQFIYTKKGEEVKHIPVGLTLSIPADLFSKEIFKEGKKAYLILFPNDGKSYQDYVI